MTNDLQAERIAYHEAGDIYTSEFVDKLIQNLSKKAELLSGSTLGWETDCRTGLHGRVFDNYAAIGFADQTAVEAAGVSIEFAGPTDRHKNFHVLPNYKPHIITNITASGYTSRIGTPGCLADVTTMPLADESVGSIHISCLDNGADGRAKAIVESSRCLKLGGFLVWDGGFEENYPVIIATGLIPRFTAFSMHFFQPRETELFSYPIFGVSGIFQKTSSQSMHY